MLAAALALLATLLMNTARANPPVPEPGVLGPDVPAAPCDPESRFDVPNYYGAKCKRLRMVFGPIVVKPGQNDLMIEPTTIEQPRYNGYITRFEPNLVTTPNPDKPTTFQAPPVEELHLHHGTWLNINRSYGSGPFMASGEEKTIAFWPYRYGMKVQTTDVWGFLYMVHNATPNPRVVWITYDIDFVKAEDAEAIQADGKPLIANTKNVWLDVGGGSFHPETKTYPFNPVYNTQKGFGATDHVWALQADPEGKPVKACEWPNDNCARFNSLGGVSAQQGKDVSSAVKGKDLRVTADLLDGKGVGTLVVMGGHLHPGGLYDRVSLVRDGVEKDIHISEAVYWDEEDGSKPGGAPTSWDFSMTGVSKDIGWSILVKEGDIIRLNAVYETEEASWYENMGIVMTWVAPGDTSGVDPFAPGVTIQDAFPKTAQYPDGHTTPTCDPSPTNICLRGQVTHGQMPENANHGRCDIDSTCVGLTNKVGPEIDRVDMVAFTYGQADFGVINATGIPQVRKGKPLLFTNLDTADYMWHTATRCKEPCTGPTTVDYPLANGGNGDPNDVMDFDSSELGVGLYPAQRVDWTLTPDREGTFTFFCRIHPSMRGAFKVVDETMDLPGYEPVQPIGPLRY